MVSSEGIQICQGQDSLHALLPAVQDACRTTADPIRVIEETKFVSLIFDTKLSFEYLKRKCLKTLDILRVLTSSEWGADVLLSKYQTLVRPRLGYCSTVYGFARNSYPGLLDKVHHQGLHLTLDAFHTLPVQSLYIEANKPTPCNRRNKLAMQYLVKLKTSTLNPTYGSVFERRSKSAYEARPNCIWPLRL